MFPFVCFVCLGRGRMRLLICTPTCAHASPSCCWRCSAVAHRVGGMRYSQRSEHKQRPRAAPGLVDVHHMHATSAL